MKMHMGVGIFAVFGTLSAFAVPTLEEGFVHPPPSAKPQTWYHIMNGNVTKAGVTRDFEELAKAGIGGVQIFDVGCDIPPGDVKFGSSEWYDILRHAHNEAKRLGLKLGVHNGSGWSCSGGPWVTPADAMKVTMHEETDVTGPSRLSRKLGRIQRDNGFYADIAVLAYPAVKKGATLSSAAEKTGRDRAGTGSLFARDTKEFPPEMVIAKDKVIDITDKMANDGTLSWDVPAGKWTIFRIGYICNGRCNHPASENGRGLEVDKLSAAAFDRHFDAYMGRICREVGLERRSRSDRPAAFSDAGLTNFHVDSWEVGSQNWTHGLEKTFERRMGYSIIPYLPILAGHIVGSVDESERFCEDFRDLLANLLAENYAGQFARRCHEYGLAMTAEPGGNSNADDMQYVQDVDVPMSCFWMDGSHGPGVYPCYDDSHYAASVAHVWGRRYAAAEAFTSGPPYGGRWLETPFSIKWQNDRAFAKGCNMIVYHRFTHQPWPHDRYLPGMTMGRWGMHLDRTQTWWKLADGWFRYQARCQWMLQEGGFVADALFWAGEAAPKFGWPKTVAPKGYDYDVCATKVVELLKVKNGKVVVPGGVEYEILVLPDTTDTMSERMMKKVGELVKHGARIVAPRRPTRTPGLRGGNVSWPDGVMECGADEALKRFGIAPDFTCDARNAAWIHRRDGSADWYFVACGNKTNATFDASFRIAGKTPEIWDAETGAIGDARQWRVEGGRTVVTLDFRPSGSVFVVFRKPSRMQHIVSVSASLDTVYEPERGLDLVIEKAEYGVFDGKAESVDITKNLTAKVRDGKIALQINNELAGRDPAPSVMKRAKIHYRSDGKAHVTEVLEGGILQVLQSSFVQPPPAWEWRNGEIFAWQPMTAKLSYSDGTARSVSANPRPPFTVDGDWCVAFPIDWYTGGANVRTVAWPALKDWTLDDDPDIKYFSGTATYRKSIPVPRSPVPVSRIMLDLGTVRDFAEVKVNGRAYPAMWRPPFRVDITDSVANAESIEFEIKVTNLWPNRLIGDDRLHAEDCEWEMRWHSWQRLNEPGIKEIPQWVKDGKASPTGRHTFTTWKHWSKKDELLPSGLIGPVKLWFGEAAASADSNK